MTAKEYPDWAYGLKQLGHDWPILPEHQRNPFWAIGLAAFGEVWPSLAPAKTGRKQRSPRRLDPRSLARAATALASARQAIQNRGDLFNPWVAARLRHDEIRNASVLAAFLAPSQVGDLAPRFLHAFLSRLNDLEDRLPSFDALQRGYRVRTEDCPLGLASERVDLTIEGSDFLIGIEVKINAPEGPHQFARYIQTIERRAEDGGRSPNVIILARRRMSVPGAIAADWGDVSIAARKVAAVDPNNLINKMLRGFAQHVASF